VRRFFGQGEVNPGHREADEGKKITDAIRQERAERASKPKLAEITWHGALRSNRFFTNGL
jgi:hypothetical protein